MSNTCATCKLWHKQPADPMNLGAGPVGECRLQPHLLVLPQRGGVELSTIYLPIAGSFPACSHYQATVVEQELPRVLLT